MSTRPIQECCPGHVAGFYTYDETHIDLQRLAVFAKAQLYLDQVIGLNLTANKVICAHHPPVAFDVLSIDIGSTPATTRTPGATQYAIPAKPVPQFLAAWEQIVAQVAADPSRPRTMGIVGGGAGGVELALNIQAKLHPILTQAGQSPETLQLHLFHRGQHLLPQHNGWVSRRLEQILRQRNIRFHCHQVVSQIIEEVEPSAHLKVICDSGLTLDVDHVFWFTQASAPSWIQASGLATDEDGFILVADTLQSMSHPHIFATGDIATMQNYQRPKAGVFAVRQGQPLFENLQRLLQGEELLPYRPQSRYLSLIGTGDQQAIASWSFLGWQSPLLWKWKDRIDRKFMDQFDALPVMAVQHHHQSDGQPQGNQNQETSFSIPGFNLDRQPIFHCAGCGSKVGSTVLERVLKRLPVQAGDNILIGLDALDDAAVLQIPADRWLVQTVDYFRSFIDDPYLFGQIATNHCLSDIFAMGATPQSALAIVHHPLRHTSKSGRNALPIDVRYPSNAARLSDTVNWGAYH